MKGAKLSEWRVSTVARTRTSRPAIPRLPTVTATEAPGETRVAIRLSRMVRATAEGTSATSGWWKCWRTRAIGGRLMEVRDAGNEESEKHGPVGAVRESGGPG